MKRRTAVVKDRLSKLFELSRKKLQMTACNKQFPECPDVPDINNSECKNCPYSEYLKGAK